MVSDSLKVIRYALKESSAIMSDTGNLPMNGFRTIGDFSTVNPTNPLMTKAHSKDWDMARLQNLGAESKVLCGGHEQIQDG